MAVSLGGKSPRVDVVQNIFKKRKYIFFKRKKELVEELL